MPEIEPVKPTPIDLLSDEDRATLVTGFNEIGRRLREQMDELLRQLCVSMQPVIDNLAALHRRFEAAGLYDIDPADIRIGPDDLDDEAYPPDRIVEICVDTSALDAVISRATANIGNAVTIRRPVVSDDVLAAVNRRADERIARWRERRATLDWGEPLTDADANWPDDNSNVCAHVCGGDAGHVCDVRATERLTYELPSGGRRTMPLCGPCHAAERAEVTV